MLLWRRCLTIRHRAAACAAYRRWDSRWGSGRSDVWCPCWRSLPPGSRLGWSGTSSPRSTVFSFVGQGGSGSRYALRLQIGSRWMRSSRGVTASGYQCQIRNSPGFDPSILRHSGIWRAADEAALNNGHKKRKIHDLTLYQRTVKFRHFFTSRPFNNTVTQNICTIF